MPSDNSFPQTKSKHSKRSSVMRSRPSSGRANSEGEGIRMELDTEGSLPPAVRDRLVYYFHQIELELINAYEENAALQEKLDLLTATNSDKAEVLDIAEGNNALKNFKKSGTQISQKLKLTYKTSTNKLVSSFRSGGGSLHQQLREFRGHNDGVWDVATSKTDQLLIGTASADQTARIWWIENGSCLQEYTGHSGSINSIRFHPSQDLVVTGSGDQTAHVWRAQVSLPSHLECLKSHSSGEDDLDGSEKEDYDGFDSAEDKHEPTYIRQPLMELTGQQGVVIAADWMSNGSHIVTASWDRNAYLFDADRGDLIQTLTGHDQELTNISCHPSQKLVVTSSKDTTFRLWDFRESSMNVNVFQGHVQPVNTAIFISGDKLVSGSDDRSVKVWDLKNMRSHLTAFRVDSAVNRLAVHPTTSFIAIPGDDRHIRIHDLNGLRICRLPRSNRQGHSRMVSATAWSEDETAKCNLFSCGFDRNVLGWSVNLSMKE